ncbi:MAG: CatB-related O-acetyltransferase [Gloeotrichia echinulata DVL01]
MNIQEIFKNPISEYLYFLLNLYTNKIKYKRYNFQQSYMSYVKKSQVGQNVKIFPYAKVIESKIGSYTYIANASTVSRTEIGKFCSIGPNCMIGLGKHPSSEYVSTSPIFYSTAKQLGITFANQDYFEEFGSITIGNDVWIGNGVVIRDDIKIGDGAIIGAGSVVTKDIPSYAIYGGVPAKLIRYRFTEDQISFLLETKWWNKDESWLRENWKNFHNINKFYDNYQFLKL